MHLQEDDPIRRQRRHGPHGDGGSVMNNQVPKYVTRARASLMLGIPEAELSRISKESGLGHVESVGNQEETYFTYEELQRICMDAARHVQVAH